MHTIINVGRSFGSGGGFVAKAVGSKLGIPVFDNELISKTAEESGYSKSLFAHGEEKSLFSVSSFFASGRLSYLDSGYMKSARLPTKATPSSSADARTTSSGTAPA